MELFGKAVDYVSTTVGPAQEYFLVKQEAYEARQDLILTGRTLFGAPSAKEMCIRDRRRGPAGQGGPGTEQGLV